MAKYYFRLALLIGSIIAFFWVIGALLPRSYSFSTQIEVAAPADRVFEEIDSLQQWQSWSRQWNPELIDGLKIEYGATTKGEGAAQTWSDIRGKGKLWITKSNPEKSVEYEMTFGNFPKMSSQIELSPAGGGTSIKWSSQGKLPGGPFYCYFGSFFSTQMRNEYDKSLEALKALVEAQDKPEVESPQANESVE